MRRIISVADTTRILAPNAFPVKPPPEAQFAAPAVRQQAVCTRKLPSARRNNSDTPSDTAGNDRAALLPAIRSLPEKNPDVPQRARIYRARSSDMKLVTHPPADSAEPSSP